MSHFTSFCPTQACTIPAVAATAVALSPRRLTAAAAAAKLGVATLPQPSCRRHHIRLSPPPQSRPSACQSRWTALLRGSGTPRPSSAPRDKISASWTDVPGGEGAELRWRRRRRRRRWRRLFLLPPPLRSLSPSSHRRRRCRRPAGAGWEKGGMKVDAGGGRLLMSGVVFGGCGGYFLGVCS